MPAQQRRTAEGEGSAPKRRKVAKTDSKLPDPSQDLAAVVRICDNGTDEGYFVWD